MAKYTKLRSQQVVIDLPTEESDPWVHATLQQVFKNDAYVTTQVIDRVGHCARPLSRFATQMVSIVDPVTGANVTVSGAGLALLIRDLMLVWIQEENGGTINEIGDLVIEEPET